jgi:hypothetical protein
MNTAGSLGYWLVDPGMPLAPGSGVRYRGIDRQPSVPGPDEDERLRSEGRAAFLQIRDRYWEEEDSGALQVDGGLAVELRDQFAAEGVELEVILAEIIETPGFGSIPQDLRVHFERWIGKWQITPRNGPTNCVVLGIDVTYPFPSFHSAIYQPQLRDAAPILMEELNDAGLFPPDRLEVAREAAKKCNELDTSWRPFCAVMISAVDTQSHRVTGD